MFSKIKEGLGYQRFRHRGLKAILCDIYLVSLGLNLNQLHRKLLKNQLEIIKYKKASKEKRKKVKSLVFCTHF